MRFEFHAKHHANAPRPGVVVEVRVGKDADSLEVAGKLALTEAEWDVFWRACEMGGDEAGVDILAYDPELAIPRGAS